MGPEDREPMEKGFKDRPTEHEVDDAVFTGQVEEPKEEETPEDKEPAE